ncbi:MAG: hypothetical protein LBT11_05705, partial [Treponema sp.]|jgi:hypothetical protein|nr:hypothetical protein [Treponema sp.]
VAVLAALALAFIAFIVETALFAKAARPVQENRPGPREPGAARFHKEPKLKAPPLQAGPGKAPLQDGLGDDFFDLPGEKLEPAGNGAGLAGNGAGLEDDFGDLPDFNFPGDDTPAAGLAGSGAGLEDRGAGLAGNGAGSEDDFGDLPDFNFPGDDTPAAGLPGEKTGLAARSGLGLEAGLRARLEAELRRAEAEGQDTTVIAMDYASGGDAEYGALADWAVEFFDNSELLFEQGEQGIAVILPNTDLDQGFAMAESFRQELPPDLDAGELCMGIAARTERQVEAPRLLFEARGALEKAREDPEAPVIAFRVDPEKYRAMIRAGERAQPNG